MIAGVTLAAALTASAFQSSGTLAGGAQYIVHRDPAASTTAIDLWYRAPSNGYDGATPGIARLALAAIAASSSSGAISPANLVKRDGGTLSFNAFPDIAFVEASVPSWQAPAVLRALGNAYFSSQITDSGLRDAVRDGAIAAAEQQFNVERVLQDALFAHMFASGPATAPPVPSAGDFSKISLAQVRAFAVRAFREQNAVVSLAGSIDDRLLADARFPIATQTQSQDAPFDSTLSHSSVDAVVSAQSAGFAVAFAGPPITDEKAATAMDFLADYLFDPNFGVLTAAFANRPDVFVNGQFITLHNAGVFIGFVGGSSAPDVRAQLLAAIAQLGTPMSASTFEAARNAFVYHITSESETPSGHAGDAGWYAAEGNATYAPGDASGRYMSLASSLDPAYVASIARTYLQHPAIVQAIVAPRAGAST